MELARKESGIRYISKGDDIKFKDHEGINVFKLNLL